MNDTTSLKTLNAGLMRAEARASKGSGARRRRPGGVFGRTAWTLVSLVVGGLALTTTAQAATSTPNAHDVQSVAARTPKGKGEITKSVSCELFAILGRKRAGKKGSPRVPGDLAFMRRELQTDQFALYKQFQLLERRPMRLSKSKPAATARFQTSGHSLTLTLRSTGAERFKLHLQLRKAAGGRSLVNIDYSTANSGGVMVIAGGYHPDGGMIFATKCSAR